jgi:flagellar hook-associated protein 2
MQGNFDIKKATSSNTSKVEVTAANTAPEGTHIIKVKQLASAQFITGAKVGKDNNGNDINMNTKLVDLGFDASQGTTIHIEHKNNTGKNIDLEIRSNTTIGDFINSLKSAGLNANFDTVQKRFFISSKNSGEENAFTIRTSSTELVKDRNAIRDFLGYDSLSTADKSKVDEYLKTYLNDNLTEDDKNTLKVKLFEFSHKQLRTKYIDDYMKEKSEDQTYMDSITQQIREELEAGLGEDETLEEDVLEAAVKDKLRQDAEIAATNEFEDWKSNVASDTNVFKMAEGELENLLNDYTTDNNESISQSGSLSKLGLGEIIEQDGELKIIGDSGAVLVKAADAVVVYNRAELTGSSNNFSVNGLTLTLKAVTAADETISLSVAGNTQAVYDMVKDFVKSYNELLKEMNEAYNAKSSRGYDPLTDEEKDAMTDDQITKWEDRIKDSLLRRDNTLGGLISAFRSSLSESVTYNGKTYSLASFGITTHNYTEKGILHIQGDEDDSAVATMENKLMEALNEDPDAVMAVISKLSDKLYSSLMDKMKTSSLSSALTVYNDKEISKTLTNYKSDLKRLEDKLQKIEDRYYKQFAAMESIMAQMNAQSSSLMSLFGMGNQG